MYILCIYIYILWAILLIYNNTNIYIHKLSYYPRSNCFDCARRYFSAFNVTDPAKIVLSLFFVDPVYRRSKLNKFHSSQDVHMTTYIFYVFIYIMHTIYWSVSMSKLSEICLKITAGWKEHFHFAQLVSQYYRFQVLSIINNINMRAIYMTNGKKYN